MPRPKGSLNKSTQKAKHGTFTRYRSFGCRCDLCREANNSSARASWQRRKHNPDVQRRCWDTNLRSLYGITANDYDAMCAAQNKVCAICGRPQKTGKRLAVDHCHKTNRVRGLLCTRCNIQLGWMELFIDVAFFYLNPEMEYAFDDVKVE